MKISDELKEKIERLLKNNEDLKRRLLSGEPEAIRKVGLISQQGINPADIIESYENNNIKYLYKKAKNLLELQEVYTKFCEEYYMNLTEQELNEK